MLNAAFPLTNINQLPFEYLDTSALALYWARSGINRAEINSGNFTAIQSQTLQQLTNMCNAQARTGKTTPGELPETLQYLSLYVYGLLKTSIMSPLT